MLELTYEELEEILKYLPPSEARNKISDELANRLSFRIADQKEREENRLADENGQCTFYMAWAGRCGRHSWKGADVQMCKPHFETKCRVCGEQAVHTCANFSGSFVCGTPVCVNHKEHRPGHTHFTLDEQVAKINRVEHGDEDY